MADAAAGDLVTETGARVLNLLLADLRSGRLSTPAAVCALLSAAAALVQAHETSVGPLPIGDDQWGVYGGMVESLRSGVACVAEPEA